VKPSQAVRFFAVSRSDSVYVINSICMVTADHMRRIT